MTSKKLILRNAEKGTVDVQKNYDTFSEVFKKNVYYYGIIFFTGNTKQTK